MAKKVKISAAVVAFIIVLSAVFYGLSYQATKQVVSIFNKTVSRQQMLEGTLKVGTLSANIFGVVSFENLAWNDDRGRVIAKIASGSFKVKPWDVITKHISVSTVTNIEINDGLLCLDFNERMNLKNIDIVKRDKTKTGLSKEEFSSALKDMNFTLSLNRCKLIALYGKREFAMNDVNAQMHMNSRDKFDIDFSAGKFGGTLEADGLNLAGSINLKPKVAIYDLKLTVNSLKPSTLGAGINVQEKVSINSKVSGPLPAPMIDGNLHMEELNLPALHFSNVIGDFHYENAFITITNVHAGVYGGNCDASGNFNIDNKHYSVDVLGHKLRSDIAAKSLLIHCLVELNLKMRGTGDHKTVLTYGEFKSGNGNYGPIVFDSITGKFNNQYGVLQFSDVEIHADAGNIYAPLFKITNGKLSLGKVFLYDPQTGEKRAFN
jgi:hypothetical protein